MSQLELLNPNRNWSIGKTYGHLKHVDISGYLYTDNLVIRNKLSVLDISADNISYIDLSNNIKFTSQNNNYLTTNTDIQDLSNDLYTYFKPLSKNGRIFVVANLTYFCSVGFGERISFQLWRDNIMIYHDISLGSTNATGGLTAVYSINLIDLPNDTNLHKYYFKYQLESNDSGIEQGISKGSIVLSEL